MSGDNLALDTEEEFVRRVLIVTGGGDAPGMNAVLRAFVKTSTELGVEVLGSHDGFAGLIEEPTRVVPLTLESVRGILPRGGSILGSSDRLHPFARMERDPGWNDRGVDLSEQVKAKLEELGVEILVLVGGDTTMDIGMRFAKMGVPVVGIPKAVDNDLAATDLSFGLDTAVSNATSAVDALHSTTDTHARVVILEVMGCEAGWVALLAGIAGGADVILIPEIHYDVDRVVDKVMTRTATGHPISIVVVGEGAKPVGGTVSNITEGHDAPAQRRNGPGAGLATLLEGRIPHEVQLTVLGHLQRGGAPSSFDRILGTRFGVHAAHLCYHDNTGHLVALRGQEIVSVPLEAAVANTKRVPPDGELVMVARSMGIELGEG